MTPLELQRLRALQGLGMLGPDHPPIVDRSGLVPPVLNNEEMLAQIVQSLGGHLTPALLAQIEQNPEAAANQLARQGISPPEANADGTPAVPAPAAAPPASAPATVPPPVTQQMPDGAPAPPLPPGINVAERPVFEDPRVAGEAVAQVNGQPTADTVDWASMMSGVQMPETPQVNLPPAAGAPTPGRIPTDNVAAAVAGAQQQGGQRVTPDTLSRILAGMM